MECRSKLHFWSFALHILAGKMVNDHVALSVPCDSSEVACHQKLLTFRDSLAFCCSHVLHRLLSILSWKMYIIWSHAIIYVFRWCQGRWNSFALKKLKWQSPWRFRDLYRLQNQSCVRSSMPMWKMAQTNTSEFYCGIFQGYRNQHLRPKGGKSLRNLYLVSISFLNVWQNSSIHDDLVFKLWSTWHFTKMTHATTCLGIGVPQTPFDLILHTSNTIFHLPKQMELTRSCYSQFVCERLGNRAIWT